MPTATKKRKKAPRATLMSVRDEPWAEVSANVTKRPKSIEQAIKASGLDWEVEQYPIFSTIERKKVELEGFVANVRSDTHETLGVVSERYRPVQNQQAFSFLASVFGTEMMFETAGSLMGGRRVWVMMKLPDFIEIGGDPMGQYAFISNSHDGKSSVTSAMTPIRIVCQNTLLAAIGKAKSVDADRVYSLRHIGDMEQKISEAREVMRVTVDYYGALKKVGDGLAQAKVKETGVDHYLRRLFPVTETMKDRAIETRESWREAVRTIFRGEGSAGDTSGNAPGTYWCLYNAAVEFLDWQREERKEGGRFQRSLDDPDAMKARAWDIVLDQSGLRVGSKNKAVAAI